MAAAKTWLGPWPVGARADVGTASGRNSKKCPPFTSVKGLPQHLPEINFLLQVPTVWPVGVGRWLGCRPGPPSPLGVACTRERVFIPGISGSKSSIWGELCAPMLEYRCPTAQNAASFGERSYRGTQGEMRSLGWPEPRMWGLYEGELWTRDREDTGRRRRLQPAARTQPCSPLIWAPSSRPVTREFLLFQPLGRWSLEQPPDKLNNKSLRRPRGLLGGTSTQGRTAL